MFLGAGSVPALFLARGGTGGAPFTGAELFAISTAFGLAVVAMVYSIGKVSGCHINPAVTLAMAFTKRMPWSQAGPYVVAQCVGGVLGGLAIWGVFAHKVKEAGVGHISYAADTAIGSAMFNEALGTAILLFTILGIVDKRGGADLLAGLVIGLIVIAIIITVAPQTGAAINPARYTGTLITAQLAGLDPDWGQAWVYWVGDCRRRPRRRARVRPARQAAARSPPPCASAPSGRTCPSTSPSRSRSGRLESLEDWGEAHERQRSSRQEDRQRPRRRRPRGTRRRRRRASRIWCGSTSSTSSIIRAEAPVANKVGIISGGGSGHEPLHGGFVGLGMLDAACAGAVFTSPVPDQMAAATKAVSAGAGVVHIVKNYTGDVLNFRMAAELSEDDGIEVATVLMDDDCAVQDSLYTAGRRGTGATVLAEKIAGARAEAGGSLAEVAAVATPRERAGAVVRRRPDVVRDARQGHADLRARPGRDRGRGRHPRRARPPPRAAHDGGGDRRPDA